MSSFDTTDTQNNSKNPHQQKNSQSLPLPSDDDSDKESTSDSSDSMDCETTQQPNTYEEYISLTKILRQKGDLQKLQHAFTQFAESFPLRPTEWNSWITEEKEIATTREEKESVLQLYHRALTDFADSVLFIQALQLACKWVDENQISSSALYNLLSVGISRGVVYQYGITTLILNSVRAIAQNLSQRDENDTLAKIEQTIQSIEQYEAMISDSIICQKFEERLSQLGANGTPDWTGNCADDVIMQYLSYAQCAENEHMDLAKGVYERAISHAFLSEQVWDAYVSFYERIDDQNMKANTAKRALRHVPRWYRGWEVSVETCTSELELVEILQSSQNHMYDSVDNIVKVTKKVITKAFELGLTTASELNNLKAASLSNYVGTSEWASTMVCLGTMLCIANELEQGRATMEAVIESRGHEPRWWLAYVSILERFNADNAIVNDVFNRAIVAVNRSRDVEILQDVWECYELCRKDAGSETISSRISHILQVCEQERNRKAEGEQNERQVRRHSVREHARAKPITKRKKPEPKTKPTAPSINGKHSKTNTEETKAITSTDKDIQMTNTNFTTSGKPSEETTNTATIEPRTIFVTNIPFGATEADLETSFKSAGKIRSIRLPRRSDKASKGIAYIEYESESAIEAALALNYTPVRGRAVWVRRSRPPVRARRSARRGTISHPRARPGRRRLVLTADIDMHDSKAADDSQQVNTSMTQDDFRALLKKS